MLGPQARPHARTRFTLTCSGFLFTDRTGLFGYLVNVLEEVFLRCIWILFVVNLPSTLLRLVLVEQEVEVQHPVSKPPLLRVSLPPPRIQGY